MLTRDESLGQLHLHGGDHQPHHEPQQHAGLLRWWSSCLKPWNLDYIVRNPFKSFRISFILVLIQENLINIMLSMSGLFLGSSLAIATFSI